MKHKKLYISCGFVLMLSAGALLARNDLFNQYFSSAKLKYLDKYMSSNYLYDFNEDKGFEMVYKGFLSGTENAMTYYLDKEDYEAALIEERGQYFGNGISFMWSLDGQAFLVTDVVKDSPADRAGIQIGDKVTKVNDIPVLMANSQSLMEAAFSTQKIEVNYVVQASDKQMKTVSLQPEEVPIADFKAEMIEDIYYIKLHKLQEGTSERIKAALDEINETQNVQGIILDLREVYSNNINEAAKVCDLFLEEGIAFEVKGKNEAPKVYEMDATSYDKKLCVIVNKYTKSAAEALAMGLSQRAKIVGSDTGGLIYIRTLVDLGDKTGMSVASGIICDQYGEPLTEQGIAPDERIYISEVEQKELAETGQVSLSNDSFIKKCIELLK